MKIWISVLSIVISLFMISCKNNTGSFLLTNNSEESILKASLKICGQMIELSNIAPFTSDIGSYQVRSDSHFDILIEFKNGKKLKKELGYVTSGVDFQHVIIVTNTDIAIQSVTVQGQRGMWTNGKRVK